MYLGKTKNYGVFFAFLSFLPSQDKKLLSASIRLQIHSNYLLRIRSKTKFHSHEEKD
jgi:hypothetical protein